ncbi:MAG: PEP-utilizing enzyme [Gammaproteobacteria bacterium]
MDKATDTPWPNPVAGAHWLRDWRIGEWLSGPISPLFETLILPRMVESKENAGLGIIPWRGMAPRALKVREPWFSVQHGYLYSRTDVKKSSTLPGMAHFLVRALLKPRWYADWLANAEPLFDQLLADLDRKPVDQLSQTELIGRIELLVSYAAEWWYPVAFGGDDVFLLGGLYNKFIPDARFPVHVLLYGYPGPQIDAEQQLWEIAEALRDLHLTTPVAEQIADPGIAPLVDAYYRRHGHLLDSIDPVYPLLREQPSRMLSAIENYLSTPQTSPIERAERATNKRVAATRAAIQTVEKKALVGPLFRRILTFTQTLAANREQVNWNFQRAFGELRPALLQLGDRLVETGQLVQSEQLFFLTWQEIKSLSGSIPTSGVEQSNPAEIADQRREAWLQQQTLNSPPRIPSLNDETWSNQGFTGGKIAADRSLTGAAASSGTARGRARVIRLPADVEQLQPGEILVAHATTPAMNSAISRAAAIVSNVGGVTTHSALIAREFGIPAVIGTEVGTEVIRDGIELEVDGDAGVVRLL